MKLKRYIYIIVIAVFFSECKKFPEDPFMSLRTVKMRLLGDWKLSKIFVNGVDCTVNYNDSLINDDFSSMKMSITRNGETSDFAGVINSEGKTNFINGINLEKNKTLLFQKWGFNSGANYSYDPLNLIYINRVLGLGSYKILKLYRKDFIIEGHNSNNTFEIQFKK